MSVAASDMGAEADEKVSTCAEPHALRKLLRPTDLSGLSLLLLMLLVLLLVRMLVFELVGCDRRTNDFGFPLASRRVARTRFSSNWSEDSHLGVLQALLHQQSSPCSTRVDICARKCSIRSAECPQRSRLKYTCNDHMMLSSYHRCAQVAVASPLRSAALVLTLGLFH